MTTQQARQESRCGELKDINLSQLVQFLDGGPDEQDSFNLGLSNCGPVIGPAEWKLSVFDEACQLKAGDQNTWLCFLGRLVNRKDDWYDRFVAMSPFRNNILCFVQFGKGFLRINGGMEAFLRAEIEARGTPEGTHAVVIPKPVATMAVRIGDGILEHRRR